jgi:hypothetical protein
MSGQLTAHGSQRRKVGVFALCAASSLLALSFVLAPAGFGGTDTDRQTAKLTFNKHRPAKPSGVTLDIDYVNPADPQAKPPAVRRVVTRLARRARLDTSVPEACRASDPELMAAGEAACPPGSEVGEGVVTVDTGLPGPARFVTADIDFLNNDDELIFVNTVRGSGARTVIRGEVRGREITTDAGMLPGTPPDGGSIDTVHVELRRVVEGGRAYIRSPKRCPRTRRWMNSVTFTYADGVTQSVDSPSACKRKKRHRRAG